MLLTFIFRRTGKEHRRVRKILHTIIDDAAECARVCKPRCRALGVAAGRVSALSINFVSFHFVGDAENLIWNLFVHTGRKYVILSYAAFRANLIWVAVALFSSRIDGTRR